LVQWLLGYPEAALADAEQALKEAREIRQAAALMYALIFTSLTHMLCGNYAAASAQSDEVVALASEKGALLFKAIGILNQGCVLPLTGKAADAVQMITSGITALRSTGATFRLPLYLPYLATAYAELGQFDDAWRCIAEAMTAIETTKETWFEANVCRMAGKVALKAPEPDAPKAEVFFERALAVARAQQAKSWELIHIPDVLADPDFTWKEGQPRQRESEVRPAWPCARGRRNEPPHRPIPAGVLL
jgi:predicted ATPase